MKVGGRRTITPREPDANSNTPGVNPSPEVVASIVSRGKKAPAAADVRGERTGVDLDVLRNLSAEVKQRLDASVVSSLSAELLFPEIETLVSKAADQNKLQLNAQEQTEIARSIVDDMMGQGPLEVLLDDDEVSEIMVNGPYNIWVEKKGQTMLSTAKFRDEAHLLEIAKRMARFVGRTLNESSPYVDARLPDGSRVNIVTSPITLDGTSISIRKFPKGKLALSDLQKFGSLSSQMAEFIECIAASRCNVLVSGGTSSGKTTILNTLGEFIRPTERVVTIEDSAELKIEIGNLVRMETRVATAESGSKAVTQRDLVANSLRMRPDRIILGEVRQAEAFDLLQAMGTGHDGSMGTLHSNNPRDTCRRLENMILMGGFDLPTKVLRSQIVSAVDFIIHAARGADGKRRVTNITEVTGLEGDTISLQDVFFYEVSDDGTTSGGFVSNPVTLRSAGKLREHGHFERAMEAILSSPKAQNKS